MVAESKQHSLVEKIIKYFLQTEHDPNVFYGFNRGDSVPIAQIVIGHVSGLDEDATIQHDVWGVDKESALQTTVDLVNLYDSVAYYQTPYGTLMGAQPVTYSWRPDEEYARYILDVRTYTTP